MKKKEKFRKQKKERVWPPNKVNFLDKSEQKYKKERV